MLRYMLVMIFLPFFFAYGSEEIRSFKQKIPHPLNDKAQGIEAETLLVPKKELSRLIGEILYREKNVSSLNVSHDGSFEAIRLKNQILSKGESRNIFTRSFNEKQLGLEGPNLVSKEAIMNYRILLIIRSAALGTVLYSSSGSSLGIAAYAAILNYFMTEALFIPNEQGRMRGVDFVNSMMKKTADKITQKNPHTTKKQLARAEAGVNFLSYYTMNVAMLIPFVGMVGADFQTYLQNFLEMETYRNSIRIALMTTVFMGSWKMAVSRWEELKRERGIEIPTRGKRSFIVNGTDFIYTFITPGFWAGEPVNIALITVMGVKGWIAYFYYDIKDRVKTMKVPFFKPAGLKCHMLFM